MAGWRDLPRLGARPPPSRRTVRFSVHTLTGKQLGRPAVLPWSRCVASRPTRRGRDAYARA
jgi:hypothetical protein